MAPPAGTAGGPPAVRARRRHRGWHRRRYLPHFDAAGVIQMITYRLADSLPVDVVRECLQTEPKDAEKRKRLEQHLDAGHGSCVLRRPEIARLVIANWLHFDTDRYQLLAWVVMPNHVHVMVDIRRGHPLSRIVHAWKSFTGKAIARMTGQRRIWQPDYWDRVIRSERHFGAAVDYIVENPVKAGLVRSADEWPWSGVAGALSAPPE